MRHSPASRVRPLEFYLRRWKVTSFSGTQVGMGPDQGFELKRGDGPNEIRLELDPLRSFGSETDWNTTFVYSPETGELKACFKGVKTQATVFAEDAKEGKRRIGCRITPSRDEQPGEWEAQEEG